MQVVEKVFVNAYFLAPDYISEQCTDKKLVWAALRRDLPETDDSKRKSLASESTVDGARSRSEKSSAALTPRKLVRGSASRSSLAELSPEFGRCSFSSVSLRGEDMVVSGIIPTFAIALPYARIIYDPNSLERMMIHLRCEKSEQRNEILRRRDEVAGLYEYIASCTSRQIPGTAEARRFFATLRRDNPPRLFTPYSAVSHGNRDGAASEASSDQALLLTSPSASNESKLQLAISANANEEGLARYPGGPPVVMLAAISHRPRYLETGVCRNSTHEEKKMRSACNTGTDGSSLPSELSSGAVVIEIAEAADLTWQAPQKCTCSETVLCPPKENSFETRYTVATGHVIVVHCPIKGQHRRRVGATSREMKRD
jgi:hypothetical protein